MWSLSIHPKCYKKKFTFLHAMYKKKMPSLSTKERKANFNKPSNYLISLSSRIDIEPMDAFFRFREWMQTFRD